MNQILENKDDKNNFEKKKRKIAIVQFYISICIFLLLLVGYFITWFVSNKKQDYVSEMIDTYQISRLYARDKPNFPTFNFDGQTYTVIGIINIPKIKISYPILSEYSDELLKIAPCKFYGPLPNENGNLCIAGHNYNNDKFFSKISLLKKGDYINITDYYSKTLSYTVTNSYEVKEDDLSPLESSSSCLKQITLVTCNNSNNNRIIVEAKLF